MNAQKQNRKGKSRWPLWALLLIVFIFIALLPVWLFFSRSPVTDTAMSDQMDEIIEDGPSDGGGNRERPR